jgi:hypothetical protein
MDPKLKKYLVVGGGLLIALIVVLTLVRLLSPNPYAITALGVTNDEQSHIQLDGTVLKMFNGVAFYSVDLADSGQSAKIYTEAGQRIPNPSSIIWADERGVLLSFDRSFLNTPVFEAARKQSVSVFELDQTTWWYDFSTGGFTYVTNKPIYNNMGVYVDNRASVYFITEDDELALYRYAIDDNKLKRLADDTIFTDSQSVERCGEGVCVVGISPLKPGLYAVWQYSDSSDTFAPLYESGAPILATGQENIYFTYNNSQSAQTEGQIPTFSSAVVVNTVEKTERSFDYTLGLDLIGVHAADSEKLAFFGDEPSRYHMLSGGLFGDQLNSFELTMDGETYEDGVLANFRTFNGGVLFGSLDNNAMLFSNNKSLRAPEVKESSIVLRALEDCGLRAELIEQINLFTITATESKAKSEFEKAGDCFKKSPEVLYGNQFLYQTVDDFNGRVTSD